MLSVILCLGPQKCDFTLLGMRSGKLHDPWADHPTRFLIRAEKDCLTVDLSIFGAWILLYIVHQLQSLMILMDILAVVLYTSVGRLKDFGQSNLFRVCKNISMFTEAIHSHLWTWHLYEDYLSFLNSKFPFIWLFSGCDQLESYLTRS